VGDGRKDAQAVSAQATTEPYIPRVATSVIAGRVLKYILLLAIAALFFVPFIWSITTSFKTIPDSINVGLIPHPWTTSAWHDIWANYDFKTYIKNSLFLAVVITALNIVLAGLGGYAFARLRFPGRNLLFLIVLLTLMVPDQLRLIPVFVMLTNWHLIATFKGYILISMITATNLFFMRQYFLTIPTDYEEAAKLDGAGYFKTFWRVMLPLALPAIAALTILQFQGTWNDFFWPLIIFGQGSPKLYTVQLGLALLRFNYSTLWPQILAGSLIAITPIFIIFVFFQRYFISGLTTAGVKG
jgi:multiple sugar transport system permease protein